MALKKNGNINLTQNFILNEFNKMCKYSTKSQHKIIGHDFNIRLNSLHSRGGSF